ncbi:MAG: hypothetical protein RRA15_01185 [bacterium]|nr:hypothetical protein [bacterium]MDT8365091.1 hypothetical protein [bacterium]
MCRYKQYLTLTLLPLAFFLVFSGCEKTIEEDVIKPIEMMVGQKSAAANQVAVSNVNNVRAALMRYPALSPSNEYPGDMDLYDYSTLRAILANANLPADMTELMWDPAYGIIYRSDGSTFTFEVRALSGDRETITATVNGVTKN